MAYLSVSIVTYAPEYELVAQTLRTLRVALEEARRAGLLAEARVEVIDNGPGDSHAAALAALEPALAYKVASGHGNVGYGRGHNLALLASQADYHLVLNPDVALAPDAIAKALEYMAAHPGVVMLAPEARGPDGGLLHLCKRYPTVLDLVLRGFAPAALRRPFAARLAHYEMRDLPRDQPSTGIPLLSGSFMFFRREPIARIGGFSDAFFLYFEDYDLSLRAAACGQLAYVPAVRIVHHGGHAARKGMHHVQLFARGAITFFGRHGWKWV